MLYRMVGSFVDGFKGVGVVGSLGIIRAIRGWTWLCRSDVQVLQKVDKELLLGLLLVLLELLLVV